METKALPRGVWRAPFRLGGKVILLAIDSRCDCIGIIPIADGVTVDSATSELRASLSERDPVPLLLIAS